MYEHKLTKISTKTNNINMALMGKWAEARMKAIHLYLVSAFKVLDHRNKSCVYI
jgi:hypothetical protein